MKNLFILLFSMLLLFACKKPYEEAVENYIKENFNDPSSYECVKLSEPQNVTLFDFAIASIREKGEKNGWCSDTIWSKIGQYREYLQEQGEDPHKVLLRYVEHTYRANNKVGAKILVREKWYLNEDMTEVTSVETNE